MKELAYQSSMELSADTYEAIKDIPTSKSIITNARQRVRFFFFYYFLLA